MCYSNGVFIKLTRRGPNRYVQLVEAYRDASTGKPKQRTVDVMVSLLRPLVDQDLAMVFYDMTTIRAEGLSKREDDLRRYGMAKVGVVECQVMLGVVQTAAHASICFMALILYRVMRSRLRDSNTKISPERALEKLPRIQHQVVKVNDLDPIAALSNINQEHTEILQALTIKKPTLPTQLTLL